MEIKNYNKLLLCLTEQNLHFISLKNRKSLRKYKHNSIINFQVGKKYFCILKQKQKLQLKVYSTPNQQTIYEQSLGISQQFYSIDIADKIYCYNQNFLIILNIKKMKLGIQEAGVGEPFLGFLNGDSLIVFQDKIRLKKN